METTLNENVFKNINKVATDLRNSNGGKSKEHFLDQYCGFGLNFLGPGSGYEN